MSNYPVNRNSTAYQNHVRSIRGGGAHFMDFKSFHQDGKPTHNTDSSYQLQQYLEATHIGPREQFSLDSDSEDEKDSPLTHTDNMIKNEQDDETSDSDNSMNSCNTYYNDSITPTNGDRLHRALMTLEDTVTKLKASNTHNMSDMITIVGIYRGNRLENITNFLDNIDRFITLNNIPDGKEAGPDCRVSYIPLLLGGKALEYFNSLPQNTKISYPSLKQALLTKYGPTTYNMVTHMELANKRMSLTETDLCSYLAPRLSVTALSPIEKGNILRQALTPYLSLHCLKNMHQAADPNGQTYDEVYTLAKNVEALRRLELGLPLAEASHNIQTVAPEDNATHPSQQAWQDIQRQVTLLTTLMSTATNTPSNSDGQADPNITSDNPTQDSTTTEADRPSNQIHYQPQDRRYGPPQTNNHSQYYDRDHNNNVYRYNSRDNNANKDKTTSQDSPNTRYNPQNTRYDDGHHHYKNRGTSYGSYSRPYNNRYHQGINNTAWSNGRNFTNHWNPQRGAYKFPNNRNNHTRFVNFHNHFNKGYNDTCQGHTTEFHQSTKYSHGHCGQNQTNSCPTTYISQIRQGGNLQTSTPIQNQPVINNTVPTFQSVRTYTTTQYTHDISDHSEQESIQKRNSKDWNSSTNVLAAIQGNNCNNNPPQVTGDGENHSQSQETNAGKYIYNVASTQTPTGALSHNITSDSITQSSTSDQDMAVITPVSTCTSYSNAPSEGNPSDMSPPTSHKVQISELKHIGTQADIDNVKFRAKAAVKNQTKKGEKQIKKTEAQAENNRIKAITIDPQNSKLEQMETQVSHNLEGDQNITSNDKTTENGDSITNSCKSFVMIKDQTPTNSSKTPKAQQQATTLSKYSDPSAQNVSKVNPNYTSPIHTIGQYITPALAQNKNNADKLLLNHTDPGQNKEIEIKQNQTLGQQQSTTHPNKHRYQGQHYYSYSIYNSRQGQYHPPHNPRPPVDPSRYSMSYSTTTYAYDKLTQKTFTHHGPEPMVLQ
jgi:hypothetical protein